MHAPHEDYSQCMQERQQEMIKCVLPVPTCLVLLGVSVELEQSIRDGGKGAPQTTHRTLVNGDWRGRVGEGGGSDDRNHTEHYLCQRRTVKVAQYANGSYDKVLIAACYSCVRKTQFSGTQPTVTTGSQSTPHLGQSLPGWSPSPSHSCPPHVACRQSGQPFCQDC